MTRAEIDAEIRRLEALKALLKAARQAKSDIDNFVNAMDACESMGEAADIARDYYRLFRETQRLLEASL